MSDRRLGFVVADLAFRQVAEECLPVIHHPAKIKLDRVWPIGARFR
jgi:hypothetical protein